MVARPAQRLSPSPSPFATAALELHGHGLAVVPLGDDTGKVPLIKFAQWKYKPGREFLERLTTQHPTANVGVQRCARVSP